ncbi:hypothetical protein BAE44_0004423, partial [Dichanthelium oligosanthes]
LPSMHPRRRCSSCQHPGRRQSVGPLAEGATLVSTPTWSSSSPRCSVARPGCTKRPFVGPLTRPSPAPGRSLPRLATATHAPPPTSGRDADDAELTPLCNTKKLSSV